MHCTDREAIAYLDHAKRKETLERQSSNLDSHAAQADHIDRHTPAQRREKPRHSSITHPGSQTQTLLHLIPNLLLVLGSPLAPHLSSLNIGRALVIRLSKHTHNRDEDLLHALDGRPALRGMFVVVWVVAGGMKDGDAYGSIGVDCNSHSSVRCFQLRIEQSEQVARRKSLLSCLGHVPFGCHTPPPMNFIVGGLRG